MYKWCFFFCCLYEWMYIYTIPKRPSAINFGNYTSIIHSHMITKWERERAFVYRFFLSSWPHSYCGTVCELPRAHTSTHIDTQAEWFPCHAQFMNCACAHIKFTLRCLFFFFALVLLVARLEEREVMYV